MPDIYHDPVVFNMQQRLANTPIEYFELTKEMFGTAASRGKSVYTTYVYPVFLGTDKYLQAGPGNNLAKLDPLVRDTAVLNFQVGVGKSTVLFDYIKQYINDPNHYYVVLYCAPFLRLIGSIKSKLEEELEQPGVCAICTEIDEKSSPEELKANLGKRVQLMTPEFLVGSGGKKFRAQLQKKYQYCQDLQKQLRASKSRVILIVDELHENTPVFDSYHLSHLLQWGQQSLIHKVFIASATFTRDSTEVIKTISYLTDRRISVFQADRQKSPAQANLHLHICKQDRNSSIYQEELPGLGRVIEKYAAASRIVHILTAQKKQTKHLMDGSYDAARAVQCLNPQVVIADNKKAFNAKGHSIGTTFKTGVNITDETAALILILPDIHPSPFSSLTGLGVFTGILTSLVQAVARLREGGDVHVFMPSFPAFIKTGNADSDKACREALEKASEKAGAVVAGTIKDVKHSMEADLWKQFGELYSGREAEYTALLSALAAGDQAGSASYRQDVGFQSWYDYVLREYTTYVDTTLHGASQGLAAYVLWMAVQDQFANCRLTEILVEEFTSLVAPFPVFPHEVYKLVCTARDAARLQNPISFHESLEQVLHYLNSEAEDAGPVQYQWRNGKRGSIFEGFEQERGVAQALYECAWKLLEVEAPKKSGSFMALLNTASSPGTAALSRYEGYFFEVQQKLDMLQKVVVTEALKSRLEKTVFFRKEIRNHIQGSPKAEEAHSALAVALENLGTSHPLYNKRVLDMPQYSKGAISKAEYLRIGEHVLARRLGLIGKRTIPGGSDAAYGVGTPHYSCCTADVLIQQ